MIVMAQIKKVVLVDLTWEELETIVREKKYECLDMAETLEWIANEMHKIAEKYDSKPCLADYVKKKRDQKGNGKKPKIKPDDDGFIM